MRAGVPWNSEVLRASPDYENCPLSIDEQANFRPCGGAKPHPVQNQVDYLVKKISNPEQRIIIRSVEETFLRHLSVERLEDVSSEQVQPLTKVVF